jgi:hypothetical protein
VCRSKDASTSTPAALLATRSSFSHAVDVLMVVCTLHSTCHELRS